MDFLLPHFSFSYIHLFCDDTVRSLLQKMLNIPDQDCKNGIDYQQSDKISHGESRIQNNCEFK